MPLALQLFGQACADSAQVLGADHPDTLARRLSLATCTTPVGRLGDSVALLHDTAVRCDRVLPYGNPLTQAVHQSLANIGGN